MEISRYVDEPHPLYGVGTRLKRSGLQIILDKTLDAAYVSTLHCFCNEKANEGITSTTARSYHL